MKQYVTPEVEIDRFTAEDIITASSDTNGIDGEGEV